MGAVLDRYLFENLGPEKFQHLCQALLIKEHPELQCFPVAQPDGGRDGLVRGSIDGTVPTVVVQVKYKRRDEEESADWMIVSVSSIFGPTQTAKFGPLRAPEGRAACRPACTGLSANG
jgi:hypothetical protein